MASCYIAVAAPQFSSQQILTTLELPSLSTHSFSGGSQERPKLRNKQNQLLNNLCLADWELVKCVAPKKLGELL